MSYQDVKLSDYSDDPIVDATPISVNIISEMRLNTQTILTVLDSHYGRRTRAAHDVVTSTESGFMTPSLLNLLDSYKTQLQEIDDILAQDDFPTYGIGIWYGEKENIPSGWAVCDGTNDTPDLRDRIPINWSTKYTMNSVGGNENATVSADAVLAAHNHTYQNCFYCAWNQGPYQRFTKYSTVRATFNGYDWDNRIYGINDTTSSTGSGSDTYNINIMPAYVSKMYIMKMPASSIPEYTYWDIVIVKPALGTITTSVQDKIRDGSRIIISVTPDLGCRVKKVKVNGKEISNNTVMYVYENLEITAECERIAYSESFFYTPANIVGTNDLTFSFTVPQDVYKLRVAAVGPANYVLSSAWDNNYRGDTDPYNKGAKDTYFGSIIARRALSLYPAQDGEAKDTIPMQPKQTMGGWDQTWNGEKLPTGSYGGSNSGGNNWCWGRYIVKELIVKPGMIISGRVAAPMKLESNFENILYAGFVWIAYGGDLVDSDIDKSKLVTPGCEFLENVAVANEVVINKPAEALKIKLQFRPVNKLTVYEVQVDGENVASNLIGDQTLTVSVTNGYTTQIKAICTTGPNTVIRAIASWDYETNIS